MSFKLSTTASSHSIPTRRTGLRHQTLQNKRFMFDRGSTTRRASRMSTRPPPSLCSRACSTGTTLPYSRMAQLAVHTISGTETDPGIIYMTMADLFQRIEDRRDEWNVEIMVAFLEIYNEEIRDPPHERPGHRGFGELPRLLDNLHSPGQLGPYFFATHHAAKAATTSRRSSSYGSKPSTANTSTSAGSPRRTYRTPRKSLRSSMQPYKRVVSDNDKRSAGKNVQWRDEAGQGDLDAVSVFPADVSSSWSSSNDAPAASAPQRSMSLGGSESEWEDENERTDDSVSFSISLPGVDARHYRVVWAVVWFARFQWGQAITAESSRPWLPQVEDESVHARKPGGGR
ncbi:hypothetical protein B0H14DRAFT_1332320 [Mycena olivaceomarginata]|nr:hypothetical protein B0H14DRAFT_1332320 [Mycena olivaceomarginata]